MGVIQASRGTRDILPDEIFYWQRVEATARTILAKAAYQEIRTPIFEQTDLFERGIGEATDVVSKEMYSFQDRGERWITLRPEGTAGVVRAFTEHNLHAQGGVQRLWYTGPMFRYERPQAGRQRQFHQLGVEVLGSADPRADAEVIAIATDLLTALDLPAWRLDLNSVGNLEDRQRYREKLVAYFTPYTQALSPEEQERLSRNPLRILDSKNPRIQAIAEAAPSIWDDLGPDSQRHFEQVQQHLSNLGIAYQLNPRLVRGLDYYTHTAFEMQVEDLGSQATVCGGGRYDRLVAELGGPDTPAVGWAIGLERLVLLLQKLDDPKGTASPSNLDFYLVAKGSRAETQALVLAQALRRTGFAVELDLSKGAFGKQLKRADRSGAPACLILGEAEAETRAVKLKWLTSGVEQAISQADLLEQAQDLQHQIAALREN